MQYVDKVNRQWLLSPIYYLGCLEQRLAVYTVTSPAVCYLFYMDNTVVNMVIYTHRLNAAGKRVLTFNLDVGFNMTYLIAPWMFSVQLANHVTCYHSNTACMS